jgi:dUTP pyrophosphatase
MSLKFKRLHPKATLPKKGTRYAAGYDLYAIEEGTIPARGKGVIPIGWSMRIPPKHYGRIAPRSGLSIKSHLDVGGGVIDEDYSKEVGVIIFNHADIDFNYDTKNPIAQIIIEVCKNDYVPIEVDELPVINSNREGGFGSTDKQICL